MIRIIIAVLLASTVARADTAEDGPGDQAAIDRGRASIQARGGHDEADAAQRRQQIENRAATASGVNSAISTERSVHDMLDSFRELVEAYRALDERDRTLDPTTSGGAPSLPVSCASNACTRCYRDAQLDLNRNVYTLNKLLNIYRRTKDYSDKAIAFGNSASGVHAVSGLAWQKEKFDIDASVDTLKKAFDAKKPELMRGLKGALDRIGACEAQYYANPDWYNRFGFFYYQFMDARIVHD